MSQLELRSVPALKKEIVRLAVAAAVQALFALWVYAFSCGLVGLGPLRLPHGVKGYEFGGMVCLLTIFTPIRTVWNLNEAVDEARKHEPLDFDALLSQMAEICRKALRELPGMLVLIPLLFLVEWMRAGTLNSIPLAGVYALIILADYLLFRRFFVQLQIPSRNEAEAPAPDSRLVLRSREQAHDLRSLRNGARNLLILGAAEAAAVVVPVLRAGFEFKMIALQPTILPNVLMLTACFLLGVEILLYGWNLYKQAGEIHPDDGKELLALKLGSLGEQLGTAREKVMMAALLSPLALIVDIYRSESAASLPWFGLAVVYYLLFELLWRRYKKQLELVRQEV